MSELFKTKEKVELVGETNLQRIKRRLNRSEGQRLLDLKMITASWKISKLR